MCRAVNKMEQYRPESRLVPEVRHLYRELARLKNRDFVINATSGGDKLAREIKQQLAILKMSRSFTELLRAMTEMTVSVNTINGGNKTNTVPDYCEADLDIRILPGEDREYVTAQLAPYLDEQMEMEFTEYREPTFSTSDNNYYRLLEDTVRELAGDEITCLPMISTGSTDSKYVRSAGIPAYGIDVMDKNFDQDIRVTVHSVNERIDIASLRLMTAFTEKVVLKYLA